MKSCIIVIDHSFRINSKIFNVAIKNYDKIAITYASNWYFNEKFKSYYKNKDKSLFRKSINYFAYSLKKKYNANLFYLRSSNPSKDIEAFCLRNNISDILYDYPLFSDNIQFSGKIKVTFVDNDTYIDSCLKMTAKSRLNYWVHNKLDKVDFCNGNAKPTFTDSVGKAFNIDNNMAIEFHKKIKSTLDNAKINIETYYKSRNERNGSTKLSSLLHHGLIDPGSLIHVLLSNTSKTNMENSKYIPLLRQLAFREISILKCRAKEISILDSAEAMAQKLLDDASYKNLMENVFEKSFSSKQFLSGNTGIEKIDNEIKFCMQNRWLPNRSRMWLAGECYWGLGGGVNALETLIEFFDKHSDDGQSPNNVISCIESMRLKYGKVMKFNEERTFRLLDGKEHVK